MSTIPQHDLTGITDVNQFMLYASQVVDAIQSALNGNLPPSALLSQTVVVQFITANTRTRIPHTLNKAVVRFVIIDVPGPAVVWRDTTAPGDVNAIYLECNFVQTVTLLLF